MIALSFIHAVIRHLLTYQLKMWLVSRLQPEMPIGHRRLVALLRGRPNHVRRSRIWLGRQPCGVMETCVELPRFLLVLPKSSKRG